jgi:hypothetical protein
MLSALPILSYEDDEDTSHVSEAAPGPKGREASPQPCPPSETVEPSVERNLASECVAAPANAAQATSAAPETHAAAASVAEDAQAGGEGEDGQFSDPEARRRRAVFTAMLLLLEKGARDNEQLTHLANPMSGDELLQVAEERFLAGVRGWPLQVHTRSSCTDSLTCKRQTTPLRAMCFASREVRQPAVWLGAASTEEAGPVALDAAAGGRRPSPARV